MCAASHDKCQHRQPHPNEFQLPVANAQSTRGGGAVRSGGPRQSGRPTTAPDDNGALFGVAEAGFYPGIILYLTWWFPSYYRSRIIGIFMTAIPISIILGSIVSSQLLLLDGWFGLQGWQWSFILEAIPPIILGVVVLVCLTDGPAYAK